MARVDKKPTLAGRTLADVVALMAASEANNPEFSKLIGAPSRPALQRALGVKYIADVLYKDFEEALAELEDPAETYRLLTQGKRMAKASGVIIESLVDFSEGCEKVLFDDRAVDHLLYKALTMVSHKSRFLPAARAAAKAQMAEEAAFTKVNSKITDRIVDAAEEASFHGPL